MGLKIFVGPGSWPGLGGRVSGTRRVPRAERSCQPRDSLSCIFGGIRPTFPIIRIFQGGHLKMSTARSGLTPELSIAYVREIFKNLESGDGKGFFDHVADDVDWIVEGTHPLAGHYHSKAEFLAHTFEKLAKVLPQGAELHVEHAFVSGDWAVVELHSDATAKNGFRFDNRYCWVCRFVNGTIVEVRAYLDSTLVARLFEENPI
jgi:uncharacterized protein